MPTDEARALLLRYLYLGTDQPFYIQKNRPLDFQVGWDIMGRIQSAQAVPDSENMADPEAKDDKKKATDDKKESKGGKKKAKADKKAAKDDKKDAKKPAKDGEEEFSEKVKFTGELVDAIVKALASDNLVRHDECLFALAFLVRMSTESEAKKNIYDKVPDTIQSSKDLFQFVYFCQTINQKVNQKDELKISFGNGMKRAIRKWYDKQDKLEDLLASDRGWYKWCHKDLIKKAHVNLEDEDKMRVLDAVCGGEGKKWLTKEEILGESKSDAKSAKAAPTDEATGDAASSAVPQTKEQLVEAAKIAKEKADSAQEAAMEAAKEYDMAVDIGEGRAILKQKAEAYADKAKTAAALAEDARKAAQKVAEAFGAKKVKKPFKKQTGMEKASEAPTAMAEAPAAPIDLEGKQEAAKAMVIAGRAAAARIALAQAADARITEAEPAEALETYTRIKGFKRMVDGEAVQQIQIYKYPLQLVPAKLRSMEEIWPLLLPDMPYRNIVQAALVLRDYKLLENEESATYKAYREALNTLTSVEQSDISPIFVYQVMRLYEEKQRYLNIVKEAIHATKVLPPEGCVRSDDPMLVRFRTVLTESLKSCKLPALKYMVTLDLRSQYTKKRVFGNRLMSCMAAQALLTVPILKQARSANVFKFTPDVASLGKVDIPTDADFFDAFGKLNDTFGKDATTDAEKDAQKDSKKKSTKVEITRPLKHAQTNKEHVDVFITIVDSLIRVNPTRNSPDDTLEIYNNRPKNPKARYIIINLCRHTQDLKVSSTMRSKDNRVLEVVGCPEEIFKVITAFVEGEFS